MSKIEYLVLAILVIQVLTFLRDFDWRRKCFPKLRKHIRCKAGNVLFYIKRWWRKNGSSN